MKSGVRTCGATYCGKKHCKLLRSISKTVYETMKRKNHISKSMLTNEGFSTEVQDRGRFFADP
jgi:hypothetical protein